jgi:Domain of unknown function (DUF1707)
MDRAGWHYPSGEFRVSDADRDQALSELREALHLGRITPDEFDERAGQALSARTGDELTVLLADLPAERSAALAPIPERSDRTLATWTIIGASALGATAFALAAAGAALSYGPTLQQQEFIREQLASQGVQVGPGFPPSQGFDWVGVIAPGAIAVLLVALAVVMSVRLARAHRGESGA